MNEKEYDKLYNDNGEGFNPYRNNNDNSNEPLWSKVESKIAKTKRFLNGMSNDDIYRGKYEAKLEILEKVYAEIKPF